jgi:antitoxin component of MazEF toxin-antitoxin module
MKINIQRLDDGFAIPVPTDFLEGLGLGEGSEMEMEIVNGRIVIQHTPTPPYRLEEMVDKISPENRHPEADFGPPVGRETW